MSDNIEIQKVRTNVIDEQSSFTGHKLKEQQQIDDCEIPRPFDVDHLMHQWQPMGIRVVVNLPIIGNDSDFLFLIRNTPYIPYYFPTNTSDTDNYIYRLNNMRNVIHGQYNTNMVVNPPGVVITQYDAPPVLASLARSFRRWRGTMHYRIRTVANFTQQAYLIATVLKNRPIDVGKYNSWWTNPRILRKDDSFRESMLNSYQMGDISLLRHYELAVPYEYPTQYYDMANWISNRGAGPYAITNEPHGDNWIAIGFRGAIAAQTTGQISFELEYRAGEDFQFSDPFLLHPKFAMGVREWHNSGNLNAIYSIPDPGITSDGQSTVTATPS